MTLPEPVRRACATWLEAMAPTGLIEGLHLRGGLGFGEWVPGRSDIDFVAVLTRRPSTADVASIQAAHEAVRTDQPTVDFDGMHLLTADLRADPELCPDVPCVLHGWFEPAAPYDLSPVAWHELAHHGVTVHGAPVADIWTDDAALRDFTRGNLDTYWRDQAESLAKFPAEAASDASCEWVVLGVARLHHLLVTGAQTTKTRAGEWGLAFYDPSWHPVLREALRLRTGVGEPSYHDTAQRGRDTAAFAAYVVEAGTAGR